MKKILSILLIITIISLAVLPAKTEAWPPTAQATNDFVIVLAVSAVIYGLMLYLIALPNFEYAQRTEVWVLSEPGKVTNINPPLDIPFFSVYKLRINEDRRVLSSPNGNDDVGSVKAGETYIIEGKTTNELGQWYKIKVSSDHLSSYIVK